MFFFYNDKEPLIQPGSIEHAYFAILQDDLETAKTVFENINSPRALWGSSLVGILNGLLQRYPSYFEIRNFLEIDTDFLLKNEKINYIELILGSLDILVQSNQEVYKYAGRVMFENKYYKTAKDYLDKSKKIFYNDPELHFLLAKYHIQFHEYESALHFIKECLHIVPDYYPAIKMKESLENTLFR